MIRELFLAGLFAAGVLVAPAIHAGTTPVAVASAESPGVATAPIPLNSSGCYWSNCTEAHQNGEGNIPQGNSHYCSKQDRDGDGIACEW
jgi:hypothetical protein